MEVLRLGWGMGLRLETQVRQMWEAATVFTEEGNEVGGREGGSGVCEPAKHVLGQAALGWLRVCVRTGGRRGHSLAPWPWPSRLQVFICEMQIQECCLGVTLWTLVSQQPPTGGSSFHCRQNELSTLG